MKYLWIAITLFVLPFTIDAQKSYEVGLLVGGSAYSGDLSPEATSFSTGEVHPALGLFFRHHLNRVIAFRVAGNYAKVSAADAASSEINRQRRNLSFESNIFELGITGEIYVLGYQAEGLQKRFSPYLFGGVSVFNFNPTTNYQGQTVELQPLGTEGQGIDGYGEPYRLTQFAIPFGLGIKYAINERLNLGMELGFRRTFTDYLDDVSGTYADYDELLQGNGQIAATLSSRTGELETGDNPIFRPEAGAIRGNPAANDWFAIGGFTLSYTFYPNNGLGRRGSKKDFGCPTF